MSEVGEKGAYGKHGPNDDAYMCASIRIAASHLIKASEFYVGYSNHRPPMTGSHPVAQALACLAEADKEVCHMANEKHDGTLFVPHGNAKAYMPVSNVELQQLHERVADGCYPQPKHVAGRLLEEAVELALEAGLEPNNILGHVTDALYNQATKLSHEIGATVFPSRMSRNINSEITGEIADVQILLRLMSMLVCDRDPVKTEREKWEAFLKKDLRVNANYIMHARKPHIK